MVLTLPWDVNVCIWFSLYLGMLMCVYGSHFTLRCVCVYMVLTLPSDVYVCIWFSLYLEM